MYAKRLSATVVTAADGSATSYVDVDFGELSQIRYVKPVSGNYLDTVDFTITVEGTGEGLWTEQNVTSSQTRAPRQATHGIDGVASLYASGGVGVGDRIAIAQDRIKIAIANGGDTKTGTFHFVLV